MRAFAWLLLGVLLTGCGNESPAAGPDNGIVGTVLLGPQCPVEIEGQPCPDTPPSEVKVLVSEQPAADLYGAGEPVAETTTDAEGKFRLALAPGSYVVTAEAGMSCEFMDVVVKVGEFSPVEVPCDTGIR